MHLYRFLVQLLSEWQVCQVNGRYKTLWRRCQLFLFNCMWVFLCQKLKMLMGSMVAKAARAPFGYRARVRAPLPTIARAPFLTLRVHLLIETRGPVGARLNYRVCIHQRIVNAWLCGECVGALRSINQHKSACLHVTL